MKARFKIAAWGCGLLVGILIAGAVVVKWHFKRDEKGRVVPWFERVDMAYLATFAKGAEKASRSVLHEGLPNPKWEKELFEAERKAKRSRQIHGHFFYEGSLSITKADEQELKRIVKGSSVFAEWGGTKLCGGYHPDYAIEWMDGDESYFALICLGCHEAKLFGPSGRLYCDIPDATYEVLKALLLKYRVNRPVAK